jgi:hypothetical protein
MNDFLLKKTKIIKSFSDEELINIYFRYKLVSLHYFCDCMLYQMKEKKVAKKTKE